jgi:hypothetical protein
MTMTASDWLMSAPSDMPLASGAMASPCAMRATSSAAVLG